MHFDGKQKRHSNCGKLPGHTAYTLHILNYVGAPPGYEKMSEHYPVSQHKALVPCTSTTIFDILIKNTRAQCLYVKTTTEHE